MYELFLILISVLSSFVAYFCIKYLHSIKQTNTTHGDHLEQRLDSLFYKNPKRIARRMRGSIPILLFLIGYLLPSSFAGFDRILLDNAIKLNQQGLYDQAATLLSGVPHGASPLMHNEMGVAQFNRGKNEQAIRNFRIAANLLPEYSQAHANLAQAYISSGRYTDAEFAFKRAQDALNSKLSPQVLYGKSNDLMKNFALRITFAIAFLLFGLKLPALIVEFLYRRRLKKYENDLPNALGILSNSLKAGLSLTQSIESLVKQTTAPISEEFNLVLKEYTLGKSIEQSLKGLYRRLPTEDNETLVNTVSLLFETGGEIPEAIESVVSTIRERRRIKLKLESLTAEGKAQAVMLLLIPVFMALVMNSLQKEVFSLLYTTIIGWMVILLMIFLALMGAWAMWKTLQIKI